MNVSKVRQILNKIRNINIAVLGDYCLDAYWQLDPEGSEISIETKLETETVKKQQYTLGGAGNIVANLAALNPAEINAIGIIGNDLFGDELKRQLIEMGTNIRWFITQHENFDTYTYGKRYIEDQEQPRIDFGRFNRRSKKTDQKILEGLKIAFKTCHVIILNQQVTDSITNEIFINDVNHLIEKYPQRIVLLDSRHYGEKFRNVFRKMNEKEAAKLVGKEIAPDDILPLTEVKWISEAIFRKSKRPVFITRGKRGLVVFDQDGFQEILGIQILKPLDPVGAGDTLLSSLACCLGADVAPVEAAEFANFAASVTVQKRFQTGTASPDEIINIAEDPDYIYQPELAEDIRNAVYYGSSEIEICSDLSSLNLGQIEHAIFDHDGTISTLRQGWETVMETVMLSAILGDQYQAIDRSTFRKLQRRVQNYIDQSSGIQTILQMKGLVDMVREFCIVSSEKIRDEFGYKKIYNDALMNHVRQRIQKVEKGELDIHDVTIKGSLQFLDALHQQGIKLYLVSGTDKEDVIAEANALGYARFFNGGIYGAVGDVNKYSKDLVIQKIMNENQLGGAELVCFGDGPVEMRKTRKYNGIAVGIASDEIRRYGLNLRKRTRLIKSGAHFILPDFTQSEVLLDLLQG